MSTHWFMFAVRCSDGSLYAGAAVDVEAAVEALNAGSGSAWVRARLPATLAHVEEYMNEQDATRRAAAFMKLARPSRERAVGTEAVRIGEFGFAS